MANGKVRTLSVRPIQSTDVAFNAAGTIASQHPTAAKLGKRVIRFALRDELLDELGRVRSDPDLSGRLLYDADTIAKKLEQVALFEFRNESIGAELDQAVASHHSLYLERFKEAETIASLLANENQARLTDLQQLLQYVIDRDSALSAAYGASGSVVSKVTSTTAHRDNAPPITKMFSAPLQMVTPPYQIQVNGGGMPAPITHQVNQVSVNPHVFKAGLNQFVAVAEELRVEQGAKPITVSGVLSQVSETIQEPVMTENDLVDLRHPFFDHKIETQSTFGDLDSELAQRRARQPRMQNLKRILKNEEEAATIEVRRRQLAYVDTFLVPPVSGTITAVFKDIGESVQAGEPILRIENDERLLLVGIVHCRALVQLETTVTVTAKNIFEGGGIMTLLGSVVAVRGHESDDDEWDIIIEIDNRNGQPLTKKDGSVVRVRLPLNFQFDRHETNIVFG